MIASEKLRGEMLSISRTPSVAKYQDLVPFLKGFDQHLSCFHNLREKQRDYLDRLDVILAPKGYWLLYARLLPADGTPATHGLAPADLESAAARFNLVWRKDSQDKIGWDAMWALFQKKE